MSNFVRWGDTVIAIYILKKEPFQHPLQRPNQCWPLEYPLRIRCGKAYGDLIDHMAYNLSFALQSQENNNHYYHLFFLAYTIPYPCVYNSWSQKMFLNMAHQTKPQPYLVFSQISRARVVRFSNRFLLWNRGIETVVLSTIKGTNGVFKNQKIFPTRVKNGLKNPKLREK